MRISAIASPFVLAALLAACGASNPSTPDDTTGADGGGATTSDGGTPADAGTPETCTDGDTQPCSGLETGSCTPGVRSCYGGTWSSCEGRKQPFPGLCDGSKDCATGQLQPGCACTVGESKRCYTGPASTSGTGYCTDGFQTCIATAGGSAWDACKGDVVPSIDDCSGRDFDCDRQLPADCSCTSGQTRACGGVTGGTCALGTQTCTDGTWGACTGAVQPQKGNCSAASCLGANIPNPGCECIVGATEPCYPGPFGTSTTGTCAAGTRTCNELGQWGACGALTSDTKPVRPLPSCDFPSCTGTPLVGCE